MKRKCRRGCKKGGGLLCIIAALMTAGGIVWLCLLSYRFFLITIAALLVFIGIVLLRRC